MTGFEERDERITGDVYAQCRLRRDLPDGREEMTSWLPKKYAVKDMVLKLRKESGRWSDGWRVVSVHSARIGVPDVRKAVRAHRRSTGDSLPKKPPTS